MATTTYLDILMDKLFACSELSEDLRLRARAELREIQRQRDILAISSRDEAAWVVPYSQSILKALVYWAKVRDHDRFTEIARRGASLVPQHHFTDLANHYSEVVVL